MSAISKTLLAAMGPIDTTNTAQRAQEDQALFDALDYFEQQETAMKAGTLTGRTVKQVLDRPLPLGGVDTSMPSFGSAHETALQQRRSFCPLSISIPGSPASDKTVLPTLSPRAFAAKTGIEWNHQKSPPSHVCSQEEVGSASGDGKVYRAPSTPSFADLPEAPEVSLVLQDLPAVLEEHQVRALKAFEERDLANQPLLIQQILEIVKGRITALPEPLQSIVRIEALSMKELSLECYTRFTPHAMRELALAFPNVETLYLNFTHVNEAHLQFLKNMPKLTALELRDCKLTSHGLKMLGDVCPQLTALDLSWLRGVKPAHLAPLARFQNLDTLKLYHCQALNDESIRYITTLPKLRLLDCAGTSLTNKGIVTLGKHPLPALEMIDISLNTKITDVFALQKLPKLDTLYTDRRTTEESCACLQALNPDFYISPAPDSDLVDAIRADLLKDKEKAQTSGKG